MKGQRYIAAVVNPSPTPSLEGRGFASVNGRDLSGVAGDFQFFEDRCQDAVGVLQHVVVPEADHAVAVGFDHPGARFVSGAVAVLPAVELDSDARQTTGEVDHIVTNRQLPSELESVQLAGAQVRPQVPFGVGHVIAQLASDAGQSFLYQGRTPIPNPFPQGKGLSVAKPA